MYIVTVLVSVIKYVGQMLHSKLYTDFTRYITAHRVFQRF